MHLQKRTYSIDMHVLSGFERSVVSGNRSVVITDLLRKYLADEERARIRRELIAGAKQVNELYREESEAWSRIEQGIYGETTDEGTAARRHRARPVRPRRRA
jgi:metal-responsive CopG/Arc/MetJ family transcriptional regulator